jgi:hypothetical protein
MSLWQCKGALNWLGAKPQARMPGYSLNAFWHFVSHQLPFMTSSTSFESIVNVLGNENDERHAGILSRLDLAKDNVDEEVELLREFALESADEEAYLDELAQQEDMNILLALDKEGLYEVAYIDTLERTQDARTLAEMQQDELYEMPISAY